MVLIGLEQGRRALPREGTQSYIAWTPLSLASSAIFAPWLESTAVSLQNELCLAIPPKLDFAVKWCFRPSAKCSGNSLPKFKRSMPGRWLAMALISFSVKQTAVLEWACHLWGWCWHNWCCLASLATELIACYPGAQPPVLDLCYMSSLIVRSPTLLPLETAGLLAFITSKFVWACVFWPVAVSLWHEPWLPKARMS